MEINYYVPRTKINYRLSELVEDGYNISMNGYTYDKLSRAPKGRSIDKTLRNMDGKLTFVIYN